jgi:predicted  nucleic acid-binding Zn-ribbon protein
MPPPEEPTRPLDPAAAPPPGRPVYEREVPVEDPVLLDSIRSLRTALVLVGLVAVAALALAAYTLITKEEESDTHASASREQVARLAERVDQLESDVDDRATKDAVKQVSDDVQSLSNRVDDVAKQASKANANAGTDDQTKAALDQINQNQQTLSNSIKDLDTRVRALEQQSSSG